MLLGLIAVVEVGLMVLKGDDINEGVEEGGVGRKR